MIHVASFIRSALVALVAGSLLVVPAEAGPRPDPNAPRPETKVVPVQADCYAIAQQIAAQNGGTVARASLSNRGGQPVCVIVIVVPGRDGQRGRRQEIVVPAG